jgi:hypothetical protein
LLPLLAALVDQCLKAQQALFIMVLLAAGHLAHFGEAVGLEVQ